jgi:hypothetical protein
VIYAVASFFLKANTQKGEFARGFASVIMLCKIPRLAMSPEGQTHKGLATRHATSVSVAVTKINPAGKQHVCCQRGSLKKNAYTPHPLDYSAVPVNEHWSWLASYRYVPAVFAGFPAVVLL